MSSKSSLHNVQVLSGSLMANTRQEHAWCDHKAHLQHLQLVCEQACDCVTLTEQRVLVVQRLPEGQDDGVGATVDLWGGA